MTTPAIPPSPLTAPAVSQADLLTTATLQLNPATKRSKPQADRVLLRATGGRHRLVLTEVQAAILTEFFAQPTTVPQALSRLLGTHDVTTWTVFSCPPLSEFYELVLQAHAAGVLVTETGRGATSLARPWPWKLPFRAAGVVGALLLVASAAVVLLSPGAAPADWAKLAAVWLLTCGLLTLGQFLAACALAGAQCEVRHGHLHWLTLLPHFRFDTGEAAMGGRRCELSVAFLRAVPVAVGAAMAARWAPDLLAPLLAGWFYVLAPWPGSAAWQGLTARFATPRFSVRSGALFEAKRWDLWLRWKNTLAGYRGSFGYITLGWGLAWVGLAFYALLQRWPAVLPGDRLPVSFGTILKLVGFLVLVAAIILLVAALWHWLAVLRSARPLRTTGPAGAAPLEGDIPAVLEKLPLFYNLSKPDLVAVAAAMEPVPVKKGETVFRENTPGEAFYVILEGEFEVLKDRPASRRRDVIARLGPGSGFGEIALLEGTLRTSTVRAIRPGRLLRLAKANFLALVNARMGTSHVRDVLQYTAFLGRLVLLAGWPFDDLLRLARSCTSTRYEAGARILRKGDNNVFFFLLFDGACEVRDGARVLRRLKPGDYFGEISLLEGGRVTADVVALEECRCLNMVCSDFLAFFSRDFRIGLRMEALAAARRGEPVFTSHVDA